MNLFGTEPQSNYKSLFSLSSANGLQGLGNNDLMQVTDGGGLSTGFSIGRQSIGFQYWVNVTQNDSLPTAAVNTVNLGLNSSNVFYYKDSDANLQYLATQLYVQNYVAANSLPSQTGNAGKFLKTDGANASWERIDLTADVDDILPPANGGTGTNVEFTAGSIVFAGLGGVYSQNNANLSWTDSTATLRVNNVVLKSDPITFNVQFGRNSMASASGAVENTAFGDNALMSLTNGDWNTAMGKNSQNLTTTGIQNTTYGGYSGASITTGSRHSIFGYAAGGFISTASDLTAIGYGSFANATVGSNTGLGLNSGSRNMTGTHNTLLGQQAGQRNITGSRNTISGYLAGSGNSTLGDTAYSDNTFMGWQAGTNINTGLSNSIYGSAAFSGTTPGITGSFNSVFGASSMSAVTSASTNAIFGDRSGTTITTGSSNVIIGSQSGQSITTGSQQLLIGYNINTNTATGTGFMSIGNAIYGTTITGTGTTISSGNIGLFNNNPGELLSLGTTGARLGVISFAGSTSGKVIIQPAAAAGTWTLTLPTTDGDSGQFLQTNGSGVTTWATAISGAAGADTQVQYNNGGAFGASADFTYNDSTKRVTFGASSATMMIGNGSFLGDITLSKSNVGGGVGYFVRNNGVNALSDAYYLASNATGSISVALTAKNALASENGFVGTTTNTDMGFRANNTEYMTIRASNGNVGIGELVPTARLVVADVTSSTLLIKGTDTTTSAAGLNLSSYASSVNITSTFSHVAGTLFAGTSSTHPFSLMSDNTVRFHIAANGNISTNGLASTQNAFEFGDSMGYSVDTHSSAPATITTPIVQVFTGSSPGSTTLDTIGTSTNRVHIFKNRGSANWTLTGSTATDIYNNAVVASVVVAPGQSLTMINDGTYWIVTGFNLINLTSQVTGVLPPANGGTGNASWTNGGLVFADSTTTLTNNATLTYDGIGSLDLDANNPSLTITCDPAQSSGLYLEANDGSGIFFMQYNASFFGAEIGTLTANDIVISILDQTEVARFTQAHNLEINNGGLKTQQPSANGAGLWKLGKLITVSSVSPVSTEVVEIDVDGDVIHLQRVTVTP